MNLRHSLLTLALVSLTGVPVQAAWDNVFQPACNNCRPQTSRYYAPPVVANASPACAPVVAYSAPASDCQQCTTKYVQRSYYQPVTTYESKSYYEPVTTYQTSYYYEPVTSYRIAYYQDPCSCCPKQVAVPQTSYALKSQCSPVQTWVERCMKVPVTTQQLAYYLEPQTTCTTTTVGAPIPMPAPACPPPSAPQAPAGPAGPTGPAGPIGGQSTPQYYFAPTTNSTGWQSPTAPTPPAQVVAAPQRIAAAGDAVQGQVTRNDGSPKAGTQVLFVNASNKEVAQAVTNDHGRFNVSLASGSYYVYFASRDNGPAYQGQVQVRPNQANDLTLVNR